MNPLKSCNDYNTNSVLELSDNVSTKLAHARALLLVGSDADFSNYCPSVVQDFMSAALACVEDVNTLLPELEKQAVVGDNK